MSLFTMGEGLSVMRASCIVWIEKIFWYSMSFLTDPARWTGVLQTAQRPEIDSLLSFLIRMSATFSHALRGARHLKQKNSSGLFFPQVLCQFASVNKIWFFLINDG